jgi:hypothetical protein
VRLAGGGHHTVVLYAMALGCGAAALVSQHDRWGYARLLQDVIRERKRGLRQFQASRRAVLGHRLGAVGNQKVNFGEDVLEGLQASFIDWHTSIVNQDGMKSKR